MIVFMMLHNALFGTAFFGLSFRGEHNIYSVVVSESAFVSALVYLFGVAAVPVAGYFLQILLHRRFFHKLTK